MSNKKDNTLEKCQQLIERLEELKKALSEVNVQQPRRPVNALGTGWSQDPSTGSFHHSLHGIITTSKNPQGGFDIKHGGRSVGRVNSINDAGARIAKYVSMLDPKAPSPSVNMDPMAVKSEDIEKSGYGPKGAGQYSVADNTRRKAKNTGDISSVGGPNVNVKSYSSKPGQLSAKQQAARAPSGPASPVKTYTPAQIAAINEARKLKKNAETGSWLQHGNIPNADEEIANLNKNNPVQVAEDMMANQLANMMQGKAMLNNPPRQLSADEFIAAGEAMGLAPTQDQIQKSEQGWNGAINNWLAEAMKPISDRFTSSEEEEAYWASVKINDRDDGKSGY